MVQEVLRPDAPVDSIVKERSERVNGMRAQLEVNGLKIDNLKLVSCKNNCEDEGKKGIQELDPQSLHLMYSSYWNCSVDFISFSAINLPTRTGMLELVSSLVCQDKSDT